MSLITYILALAITSGPIAPSRAERLAGYIVKTSPKAAPYAREMAERILFEADTRGLDPAMFAAIGYMESRYLLYPHGGKPETHLAAPWQIYPTREWLEISRAQRMVLSRDLAVSTWRAANILSWHVSRVRRGRNPHTPATYCRYNRTPCRRGYRAELWKQSRIIREVVGL
jgi:hypothetical protein